LAFFYFFFEYHYHLRDLHSFPTRRSSDLILGKRADLCRFGHCCSHKLRDPRHRDVRRRQLAELVLGRRQVLFRVERHQSTSSARDRKSTRLNSSHVAISYAVFCLKKKKYI